MHKQGTQLNSLYFQVFLLSLILSSSFLPPLLSKWVKMVQCTWTLTSSISQNNEVQHQKAITHIHFCSSIWHLLHLIFLCEVLS